jgi:hypothetical protein
VTLRGFSIIRRTSSEPENLLTMARQDAAGFRCGV